MIRLFIETVRDAKACCCWLPLLLWVSLGSIILINLLD